MKTHRLTRADFPPRFSRFPLLAMLAFVIWAVSSIAFAQSGTPEVVGEIMTAIGHGVVRGPAGEIPAARGARIHAGDQIETAEGGHVHIRFVDGGLISVRPLSRLFVEEYRNSSPQGLAAIKFRLEEGVVRSVTGQWGQASRDRFRLNTPIAAIGVKGTDFVVKVEQGKTSASVISGAIVMAPLEGGCVGSLGPCQSKNATFLSAEMHGQMLEYLQKNDREGPRLVPSVDLLARNSATMPPDELRRVEALAAVDKVRSSDPLVADALDDGALPRGLPLIWLHNTLGWNVPEHTISERQSAELVAGREPVIGNFFINLYRDNAILSSFQPQTASANFRLADASANFTQPADFNLPVEQVQISNASLNVDFARATFATQMQLSSPALGQAQFQMTGGINNRGVFAAREEGQSMAGAFSLDGRQAGYLFDKTLSNGKVSGLTLWGR